MAGGAAVRRVAGHAILAFLVAVLAMLGGGFLVLTGAVLSSQAVGTTRAEGIPQGSLLRHYLVYRPTTVPPHPGLVIDLHPSGANGFFEAATTRLYSHADRLGWIVAYPDAVGKGWKSYGCCRDEGVDDTVFLGKLIDRLEMTDSVDPNRVFVTGLSRGGMMAYRAACELSSRIAAIAVVAGNMADEHADVRATGCRPDRPVSLLAIHGTADKAVPLNGAGRFAPFAEVVGLWRELNGCATQAEEVTRPGSSTVSTWSCRAGADVESIVVAGAGHTFPGTPLASLPWSPAAQLDASTTIANFFAGQRRVPSRN